MNFNFEMRISVSEFILSFISRKKTIDKLDKRYSAFRSTRKPDYFFSVRFNRSGVIPFKPKIQIIDNVLQIKRGDFLCSVNLKTKKGILEISPKIQSFDSFLRAFMSWLLIQNNGFLVHGAGAVINGKGYLFVGKSGAGKSTICKTFRQTDICSGKSCFANEYVAKRKSEIEILTDELTPVRIINGKIKIYPSPFWGEMKQGYGSQVTSLGSQAAGREKKARAFPYWGVILNGGQCGNEDGGAQLKKIFFLEKAKFNKIEKIANIRFYKKMLRCIMNFSRSPEDTPKIMKTLDKIANKTKFFELKFSHTKMNLIDFVI